LDFSIIGDRIIKKIKFWWPCATPNFGDLLTPEILNYFEIPYEWSNEFDALCVGSIASYAKPGTIVLGSGIIGSNQKVSADAMWKFVRGPHTRKKILEAGGDCPEIYGDPALLIPLMYRESKKEFDIGIVPHYVDLPFVREKYPNYKIINLKNTNCEETVKEITKCRYIISSSLHGIIAAHAYGIPAAWATFTGKLKGDNIKFIDYFDSVQLETVKSTVEDPVFSIPNSIDIRSIENIFKDFKHEIIHNISK
jgi:pyruvyltransferase